MTIGRSVQKTTMTKEVLRTVYNFPVKGEDALPLMRHPVLVREKKNPRMILLGHAVTHLSLDDWATLNGYYIEKRYGAELSRHAFPNERTDLK